MVNSAHNNVYRVLWPCESVQIYTLAKKHSDVYVCGCVLENVQINNEVREVNFGGSRNNSQYQSVTNQIKWNATCVALSYPIAKEYTTRVPEQ